jgi:nucleotide-binding universal stress UspA family protein
MIRNLWKTPRTPQDLDGEQDAFLSALPSSDTIPWNTRMVEGHAATLIVHEAAESQADVIVMSTHSRTGLAQMIFGSVAEEVVRAASCSILTIRPEAFRFEAP